MTKRTAPKKKSDKLPLDLEINRRGEWRFDLPLAAVVTGKLPTGKKLEEKTILENISSGGAFFLLKSPIPVGFKFKITVEVPHKLTEGKKVFLKLNGTVLRLIKVEKKTKKQGVAVRFGKDYEFVTAPKRAAAKKPAPKKKPAAKKKG
jgi:c-di-GMP-binding flagellar brake protein YcgR